MLQAIPIGSIVVAENRQRSSIDEPRIAELRASFLAVGQLQPIVIEPIADDRWRLIVGERRLRARQGMTEAIRCGPIMLPPDGIGAIFWDDLTDAQRYEMELEENIRRVDLTWQDQCRAATRLNELRRAQAAASGEHYGSAMLGEELGIPGPRPEAAARANTLLTIAKHLDDPNVSSAKTLKEAQKEVDKKIKRIELAGLASVFEARAKAESPHTLLRGDCYEVMKTLPESHFDIILTDPPYGIGADEFGSQSGEGHEYKDDKALVERLCWEFPMHAQRLLKAQAHVYMFCDFMHFEALKGGFEIEGFIVWRLPLIWSKGNGMLPKPTLGPRRTYECILFANKGQRPVEIVASDVISVPLVQSPRHGAEKPVGVYRDLLGRSSRPGNRVLDPFCGSGTIFPAASLSKLSATGIELNDTYADLAASRIIEALAGTSVLDLV